MRSLRLLIIVSFFGIGMLYGWLKRPVSAPGPPVHILALGDSYTIGQGVPESDRWPEQLAALMRARGYTVVDPTLVAKTGWTSADLLAGIAAAPELKDPPAYDLVALMIGVNNVYQGRSQAEYSQEFKALLGQAVALSGNRPERVIVVSIPDWGATQMLSEAERKTTTDRTDAFNRINLALSRAQGASYVDITDLTRQVGAHPDWLAPDHLHYSAAMHVQWAERVLLRYRQVAPAPISEPGG